jgi:hypothetical protein
MDAEPTPPPATRKVKKQVRKADLPIVGGGLSLDVALKNAYKEKEAEMTMADKLVADTEDRKNALEEYIYDMRGKLDDIYADYASEDEKTKLRAMLDAAEVRSLHFLTNIRNGSMMKAKMLPRMRISPRWRNFSLSVVPFVNVSLMLKSRHDKRRFELNRNVKQRRNASVMKPQPQRRHKRRRINRLPMRCKLMARKRAPLFKMRR